MFQKRACNARISLGPRISYAVCLTKKSELQKLEIYSKADQELVAFMQ